MEIRNLDHKLIIIQMMVSSTKVGDKGEEWIDVILLLHLITIKSNQSIMIVIRPREKSGWI